MNQSARLFVLVFSAVFGSFAHADVVNKGIIVSGECSKSVPSDRGSIVLTADFVKPSIAKASHESTQKYEQLKAEIKALKLENLNLQTTEYSIQEVRDFIKSKSVFRGYRSRIGLQVSTSDIQRLGEVLAIASKLEIQDVGQLRNFLSESKLKTERDSCLQDAVVDARRRAERLAEAAHVKVGKVQTISESGSSSPYPVSGMHLKSFAGADVANIVAAPEQISVQVSVNYGVD